VMHPRWQRAVTAAAEPRPIPVQSSAVPQTTQQSQAPRRAVAELSLQRLYHLRMGHVATKNLHRMVSQVALNGFPKQLEVSFTESATGSS
jgi:hypothetical protein